MTDGLDGLAIVPVMIAAASLGLIVYLVGNFNFSNYLELHFVRGSSANSPSSAGRLWARARLPVVQRAPAMIFMGDTGSLSLGGALGAAIAVAAKHGDRARHHRRAVRALETASVIIQVASFKLTGKRVFDRMAPLHHHFEQKGWKEPTIVIRFLDHRHRAGPDRPFDAEAEVIGVFPAATFRDKRVAVFGLARSGTAVSRRCGLGGAVRPWLGRFRAGGREGESGWPADHQSARSRFKQLDALVLSPGVAPDTSRAAHGPF